MPKTSAVEFHPLNPETHDHAVASFLRWANEDLQKVSVRSGDRRQWALRSFTGNMGLAAYSAERAADLRGHRYSLLSNRDRSIDEAFARYEADERRPAARAAA
jgi:hypothetical protein